MWARGEVSGFRTQAAPFTRSVNRGSYLTSAVLALLLCHLGTVRGPYCFWLLGGRGECTRASPVLVKEPSTKRRRVSFPPAHQPPHPEAELSSWAPSRLVPSDLQCLHLGNKDKQGQAFSRCSAKRSATLKLLTSRNRMSTEDLTSWGESRGRVGWGFQTLGVAQSQGNQSPPFHPSCGQ